MEPSTALESSDLLDREVAEAVLADLALALLSPNPPPGQIVVPTTRDTAPQSIAEPVQSAVLFLDADGRILAFSGEAEHVFGRRTGDVLGKDVSVVLNLGTEHVARLIRDPRRAATEIAPRTRGRHRDGAEFVVALGAISFAVGRRRMVALFIDDLNARHARDARARKAEMRHRLLIEQIPAVTFIAAMDEGVNELYVSPQIESLLGFSQQEWLENPILWFNQLHPDDRDALNLEFARGVTAGGPFRAEVRVFTKDRRVVWVRGEGRLVRDEHGRPLFFHGVAFDVTDTKRAEERMREAHEMKIRNERLAVVGQMAASISHDLRNPLGAVRNAWFYVQRRITGSALAKADARIETLSSIIDRELARCSTIIDDLLDFTRSRPPSRAGCAIDELVRDVFHLARASSGNVQLVSEVPADLPIGYLDVQQMERALLNLVQNAVEAVDPQTGVVRVSARIEDEALVIEVSDNGPGVPAGTAARIFEPLFTTKTRGTGLGLSIVANIVRAHGGTVDVDPTIKSGARFRVHIPTDVSALERR